MTGQGSKKAPHVENFGATQTTSGQGASHNTNREQNKTVYMYISGQKADVIMQRFVNITIQIADATSGAVAQHLGVVGWWGGGVEGT